MKLSQNQNNRQGLNRRIIKILHKLHKMIFWCERNPNQLDQIKWMTHVLDCGNLCLDTLEVLLNLSSSRQLKNKGVRRWKVLIILIKIKMSTIWYILVQLEKVILSQTTSKIFPMKKKVKNQKQKSKFQFVSISLSSVCLRL